MQKVPSKDQKKVPETSVIPVSELRKHWKYEKIEGGGVRILGYKGAETQVVVPSKIGKEPVKEIGHHAFSPDASYLTSEIRERRKHLVSIAIPKGVVKIGAGAFCNCSTLAAIILPEGLKQIGFIDLNWITGMQGVFCNCKSLTHVTIPKSVTKIGNCTFCGCTALVSLTFLGKSVNISIFADIDLHNSPSLTIYAPAGSSAEECAEKYHIPFIAE